MSNAKDTSWKIFCTDNAEQNIFGLPYKIALEKLRKPIIIPPILKEECTLIAGILKSLGHILPHLFQKDNSEIDTPAQKETRANINMETYNPDDLYFIKNEVEKNLKNWNLEVVQG